MSTRTAYAGTAEDGDIYTAANHAKMAGGWVAHDESASNQTTSSTTVLTLHTLVVPVNAARRYRVTVHVGRLTYTVPTDSFTGRINIGGTNKYASGTIGDHQDAMTMVGIFDSTTAGTVTVLATLQRLDGTGTCTATRSSTNIGFMLVEDIGPAPA
jgi:hypothetical protein